MSHFFMFFYIYHTNFFSHFTFIFITTITPKPPFTKFLCLFKRNCGNFTNIINNFFIKNILINYTRNNLFLLMWRKFIPPRGTWMIFLIIKKSKIIKKKAVKRFEFFLLHRASLTAYTLFFYPKIKII